MLPIRRGKHTTDDLSAPDLHTWKEVAEYLQVSVRTAQQWEKLHGLPIKRLPGARGGILARAAELDAWKLSEQPASALQKSTPSTVALAAAIAAISIVCIGYRLWPRPQPIAIQVSKDFLVVLDERGRELWRKQFNLDLSHYQNVKRPLSWVGDLEGDGDNEVLFVPAPHADFTETTPLICFGHSGEEKWRYVPGGYVRFGQEDYPPPFFVDGFVVGPIRRGGPNHILVNGRHHRYFPTQVSLLSTEGTRRREYWHAGYFNAFLFHDLDGDGQQEIYLAGINNGRKMAELVILDPERFHGAGEERSSPAYQMNSMDPGVEIRRVFFPRTCVNRVIGSQYNAAKILQSQPDGLIVGVEESLHSQGGQTVYYHLDRNLTITSASASDAFLDLHQLLFQQRLIDHDWSSGEEGRFADLARQVNGIGAK